jgi:hypothetical protein
MAIAQDRVENTDSQLAHCYMLGICCGHYITLAVFIESLLSNGSTCYSTYAANVWWSRVKFKTSGAELKVGLLGHYWSNVDSSNSCN